MLERISSRELSEWMAYYRLEPFGQERDNLHAGMMAAAVYNVNRAKNQQAIGAEEFLINLQPEEEAKTPQEIFGMLRTWALLNKAPRREE